MSLRGLVIVGLCLFIYLNVAESRQKRDTPDIFHKNKTNSNATDSRRKRYATFNATESRRKRQSNPCDTNPCLNGGTCTVSGSTYTCTCTSEFTGTDCESQGRCIGTGWHLYGDNCYKFITTTSDWDTANTSCITDENGFLVEIKSAAQNRFLTSTGNQISGLGSGLWNGMRWHFMWDTYYWVHSATTLDYDNRESGCNANRWGYKYCYVLNQGNGNWCQRNCTIASNYICQRVADDDPCLPNPCQSGGTCTINGNDYTCSCPTGFKGKSCETSGYCPPGWAHYGRTCYKFSSSTKTFDAAKSTCISEESGVIAEIKNVETNNVLETTAQSKSSLTNLVWIGLRWHMDWDTYYWVPSNVVSTYDNFLGTCNTGHAYQNCFTLNKSNGKWCQQSCSVASNYICQKAVTDNPCTAMPCKNGGTCTQQTNSYTCSCATGYMGTHCEKSCPSGWSSYGSKCYKFYTATKTWAAAKTACASSGGHLVQVDNAAMNSFLHELRKSQNYPEAWIGLNDAHTESVYKWDGSQQVASYTNWNNGEPNNGDGTGEEDCVVMANAGKNNDYYCSGERAYFCERNPTSS